MKLEVKASYSRGFGYTYKQDTELSEPAREISQEEAKQYMGLLESMGLRKHETQSQIFYDQHTDSNHVTEYIFWK